MGWVLSVPRSMDRCGDFLAWPYQIRSFVHFVVVVYHGLVARFSVIHLPDVTVTDFLSSPC